MQTYLFTVHVSASSTGSNSCTVKA